MRTTSRVAALALSLSVGLAALTACSDDDPPSADPSPTWSPTGKMETPTSPAADPVEPELPVAATEASEAGARAFITYYWELINYAQVTGDVKALKAVSGPNCAGCNAGIRAIRRVYRNGGHVTDGSYGVVVGETKPLEVKGEDVEAFEITANVSNGAHSSVTNDGIETSFAPDDNQYLLYVLWAGGRWRLDVMELR